MALSVCTKYLRSPGCGPSSNAVPQYPGTGSRPVESGRLGANSLTRAMPWAKGKRQCPRNQTRARLGSGRTGKGLPLAVPKPGL